MWRMRLVYSQNEGRNSAQSLGIWGLIENRGIGKKNITDILQKITSWVGTEDPLNIEDG
jgi:hypothetical protein